MKLTHYLFRWRSVMIKSTAVLVLLSVALLFLPSSASSVDYYLGDPDRISSSYGWTEAGVDITVVPTTPAHDDWTLIGAIEGGCSISRDFSSRVGTETFFLFTVTSNSYVPTCCWVAEYVTSNGVVGSWSISSQVEGWTQRVFVAPVDLTAAWHSFRIRCTDDAPCADIHVRQVFVTPISFADSFETGTVSSWSGVVQ